MRKIQVFDQPGRETDLAVKAVTGGVLLSQGDASGRNINPRHLKTQLREADGRDSWSATDVQQRARAGIVEFPRLAINKPGRIPRPIFRAEHGGEGNVSGREAARAF